MIKVEIDDALLDGTGDIYYPAIEAEIKSLKEDIRHHKRVLSEYQDAGLSAGNDTGYNYGTEMDQIGFDECILRQYKRLASAIDKACKNANENSDTAFNRDDTHFLTLDNLKGTVFLNDLRDSIDLSESLDVAFHNVDEWRKVTKEILLMLPHIMINGVMYYGVNNNN